jgi:hypothetical protein
MEEQKRRGRERNNKTSLYLGPPSGFDGWKEKVK